MIYLVAIYVLSSIPFMCFSVWRDIKMLSNLIALKTVIRDRDYWEELFKQSNSELRMLKAKINSEVKP